MDTSEKVTAMPKAALPAELGVVGETVRHYREAIGLSQERLGGKADLTGNTVSKIEQGATEDPAFSTICKLADALGVTTDALRRRVQ